MSEIRTLTVRSTDSPNLQRPPQSQSVSGPGHGDQVPTILIEDEPRVARINSPAPKRPRLDEEHHQVVILQQHPSLQGLQNFGLIHPALEVESYLCITSGDRNLPTMHFRPGPIQPIPTTDSLSWIPFQQKRCRPTAPRLHL